MRRKRTFGQAIVGYIPAGPPTFASSRLQVYLPLQHLLAAQPQSFHLLRQPREFHSRLGFREAVRILARVLRSRINTVVFQKVRKGAAPGLMLLFRILGRRIIYVESDLRKSLRFARYVDTVVTPSLRLSEYFRGKTGLMTICIPDPVEAWNREALTKPWQPKPRYRTLWVGHKSNWHQIVELRRQLEAVSIEAFDIVTVSNHPDADLQWSLEGMRVELARADLGIIPVTSDPRSGMKSHNRATMFMAHGIPVLVSNSEVYSGLVEDGETGFVFEDVSDLKRLASRLASAANVERVRAAAMQRAEIYSIERVVDQWRDLFSAEPARGTSASRSAMG